MCSIAGSPNYEEVAEMLSLMKHRAPDDTGIAFDKKFSLGMGRLAILDLKSDNLCPHSDGNYVLSFNGEIYNYKELKKELKEFEFKTESDTEVLLKSYRKWGVKCLEKFNGMFAFAIYDGKKVFMARDIAGEKPLYYTEKPFRIASEAKALKTPKELPPAHYGIYDFKEFRVKRYWEPKTRMIDERYAVNELDELVADSIKLRTQSDVPYGLYYSGGIDSELISSYHNFKHRFTYEDGNYKKEFLKVFPKILWHLDYPVSSFSPFGLWKLSEMAAKKVKVVLSGEGADELFGGYVRYVQPHFNYEAQKVFPSYPQMFQPAKSVSEQGWEEFNGNLQELLRMEDRMAGAFGLENRCPFLDKRIIEFAYSLSDYWKIQGTETKVILRKLLHKRKPSYKFQEKHGLFVRVNEWLGIRDSFDKNVYREYQQKIWRQVLS